MDHVVTENIKTNKYQHNDAVYNEPTFDTNSFNLSSGTKNSIPAVIVSLQGGKKNESTTVDGLTFFWDIGDTKSMIKRIHTKYYEHKMWSNKV